jgi:starch phosphorylase
VAGREASSTGNLKFAMNGALTIGTLDGVNVDIREEVGQENFFLFGLTAEEVKNLKGAGYDPRRYCHEDAELRETMHLISSGFFSRGDQELFKPLMDSLLQHEEYVLLADYRSYVDRQDEVGRFFQNDKQWTRMSTLNTARMGTFSSDRAIREYCEKIWRIQPL